MRYFCRGRRFCFAHTNVIQMFVHLGPFKFVYKIKMTDLVMILVVNLTFLKIWDLILKFKVLTHVVWSKFHECVSGDWGPEVSVRWDMSALLNKCHSNVYSLDPFTWIIFRHSKLLSTFLSQFFLSAFILKSGNKSLIEVFSQVNEDKKCLQTDSQMSIQFKWQTYIHLTSCDLVKVWLTCVQAAVRGSVM